MYNIETANRRRQLLYGWDRVEKYVWVNASGIRAALKDPGIACKRFDSDTSRKRLQSVFMHSEIRMEDSAFQTRRNGNLAKVETAGIYC